MNLKKRQHVFSLISSIGSSSIGYLMNYFTSALEDFLKILEHKDLQMGNPSNQGKSVLVWICIRRVFDRWGIL